MEGNIEESVIQIGKLSSYQKESLDLIVSDQYFGTIFPGKFEGITDVTTRRYLISQFVVDLDSFRKVRNHPNILKYICSEQDVNFL